VAEDAEALTPLIGEYEVSKWLTVVPHPYTLADAHWFIGSDGNQPVKNWAITHQNRLVGVIGTTSELGYWLGRAHWRQGIMAEAAQVVVNAHFTQSDAADMASGYFTGNAGSQAILTGLGFVDTHVEQVHSKAQDKIVPLQRMKLTRSDWQAANA
jgi:RimJ/RimL family protein N-acetyltransferase